MAVVANMEIRHAAKEANVRLWQVAEKLGVNDGNLSRRLRRELPADEQQSILRIIADIAAEQSAQEGAS